MLSIISSVDQVRKISPFWRQTENVCEFLFDSDYSRSLVIVLSVKVTHGIVGGCKDTLQSPVATHNQVGTRGKVLEWGGYVVVAMRGSSVSPYRN